MEIAILCNDPVHPIQPLLVSWANRHKTNHNVSIYFDIGDVEPADILFLVSCTQIIKQISRANFSHTLVLHASDLPEGRGWSPHIWAILGGAKDITVSLLEADDIVDNGVIWAKKRFSVPDHALYDEINTALFETELELMDEAVRQVSNGLPVPLLEQTQRPSSWYPKRKPVDSEIDPAFPIAKQFDTIRVADPKRYPAFFSFRGHRYVVTLTKVDSDEFD